MKIVIAFLAMIAVLQAEEFSFKQPLMGTLFRIKLHADSEGEAEKASNAAFKRVAELEVIFSDYNADSEVVQLLEKPIGEPVKVSDELFDAVELARKISAETSGKFDITIGPHVRNWRMARRTGKLPSAEKITQAQAATGMNKLLSNSRDRTLTLTVPGMRLDFGGIAKGIAADEALAVLSKMGFPRGIVAAGGDLSIGDPPPGKKGWLIEILSADGEGRTRRLRNVGVSTSGDAEQSINIDGKRYSHIVDSSTGLGLRHSESVTVIAPSASWSDPLATAFSLGGKYSFDIEGITVIRSGSVERQK